MQLSAIILDYEEHDNEWMDKELTKAGVKEIIHCSRDGVGSMSRAFNAGISKADTGNDLLFITNVIFDRTCVQQMHKALHEEEYTGAVHPRFFSDHLFIRHGSGPMPFIEWTMPMVKRACLDQVGILDEDMPYELFDIDWGWRARSLHWQLLVTEPGIKHDYMRHSAPHPVKEARQKAREYFLEKSHRKMVDKYGPHWKMDLWSGSSDELLNILHYDFSIYA